MLPVLRINHGAGGSYFQPGGWGHDGTGFFHDSILRFSYFAELFLVNRCLHFFRDILGNYLHSVIFFCMLSNLGHYLLVILAACNEITIQPNRPAFHYLCHN